MAKGEQAPILIRRKKVIAHGHHGGAWKVAFADFMTAMFALFLVLWLVNQSSEVRDAIANYFRDPVGFEHGGFRTMLPGGNDGASPEGAMAGGDMQNRRRPRLGRTAEQIRSALAARSSVSGLSSRVSVEMMPDGLRISLTDDDIDSFFASGSAQMSVGAAEILAIVGDQLKDVRHDVTIEGHTDARPYRGRENYGNWELSTERANEARRALIAAGLPEARVAQVRGFADRDLLDPENPMSPHNRRITITVLDRESAPEPAAARHSETEAPHGEAEAAHADAAAHEAEAPHADAAPHEAEAPHDAPRAHHDDEHDTHPTESP